MEHPLILTLVILCAISGIVLTRLWARRKEDGMIRSRVSTILSEESRETVPETLLRHKEWTQLPSMERIFRNVPGMADLNGLLEQCGFSGYLAEFIAIELLLLSFPPLVALALGLNILPGLALGLAAGTIPMLVLIVKRSRERKKFREQLPNAIDLMVSVLRSGHSIPQAVKSVAEEIPDPVGKEFAQVLRRMNLGQSLSQALFYSTGKFDSYELDLIRRAVAIQNEVGGSLAELLSKTNNTLRGRLKLVRQVHTLTGQSRLTAWIVGLLPLVLALFVQFNNPGYLDPLLKTDLGRIALTGAVFLEVLGLVIMRRMSTIKV